MLTKNVRVTVRRVRPTTTDVERGVDVQVNVLAPHGLEVEGVVTLLPRADGSGEYGSWGDCAEHWVSDTILAAIRDWPREEYREMLRMIEVEAAAAAARVSRG